MYKNDTGRTEGEYKILHWNLKGDTLHINSLPCLFIDIHFMPINAHIIAT